MGNGGTSAIARLKKVDVERLLAGYDDDPIAALTAALGVTLELPTATWPALVAAAPIENERRQMLLDEDQAALDALVTELNEQRCLDGPPANTPASRPAGGGDSARSTDNRSR